MRALYIIGAGGHGRVVADMAGRNGYGAIAFLDDDASKTECAGRRVIGPLADAPSYGDGEFIVAVGDAAARQRIQRELERLGLRLATLIHPSAVVAEGTRIGAGTVVAAGVVLNPGAQVGEGVILNTSSSVDHDCVVGDYAHISVGAHLAGTVTVGARTLIGAGATVCNGISICADCVVGAGAVVIADADVPGTYVGVPARRIAGSNRAREEPR